LVIDSADQSLGTAADRTLLGDQLSRSIFPVALNLELRVRDRDACAVSWPSVSSQSSKWRPLYRSRRKCRQWFTIAQSIANGTFDRSRYPLTVIHFERIPAEITF
jgi:hypothetical protein